MLPEFCSRYRPLLGRIPGWRTPFLYPGNRRPAQRDPVGNAARIPAPPIPAILPAVLNVAAGRERFVNANHP